jgi:hypothetical protein
MSYSVESSSTTISSCSPTSATSTSPEGSSLLYEKANKGLGLAQDSKQKGNTLYSSESSRPYKKKYMKSGQTFILKDICQGAKDFHSTCSSKCIPLTKLFQGDNVITTLVSWCLSPPKN